MRKMDFINSITAKEQICHLKSDKKMKTKTLMNIGIKVVFLRIAIRTS